MLNASTGRNNSTEVKMKPFVISRGLQLRLLAGADGEGSAHRGRSRRSSRSPAAADPVRRDAVGDRPRRGSAPRPTTPRSIAISRRWPPERAADGPAGPDRRGRRRRRVAPARRRACRPCCAIEGAGDDILLRLDDGARGLRGTAAPDIVLAAAEDDWARLLAVPPPPRFQAFTALAIANPGLHPRRVTRS